MHLRDSLGAAAATQTIWFVHDGAPLLSRNDPTARRQHLGPEAGTLVERFDAVSVAKAQQAISEEILLEPLARTLLRVVMQNAGAQNGYLSVEGNRELRAVMQYGPGG